MVIPRVQLPLFSGNPSFDATFRALERHELGLGAWLDRVPGWVSNDAALFARLERELEWRHERRPMYTRIVDVPRLLASVPSTGIVEEMRVALSDRYGERFVRTSAALYRNGRDSVAFHGDTTARDMLEAVVATISLGGPRTFLIKPADGGRSQSFALGGGDLVVMGGTAQRTWRHAIPKVAHAAARIALMFRPAWG